MQNELARQIVQNISEINQDIARANVLRREIGMLKQVQPNLSGIPARQNLQRIAEREDELQTLACLIDLTERVGVEDMARHELLSR